MDDSNIMGQSRSKHSRNDTPKDMGVTVLLSALEYVSQKLWQKTKTHHTLIVSGGVVFVLLFRSRPCTKDVNFLHASHLDVKAKAVLAAAIKRAAEKQPLPKAWLNNSEERNISAEDLETIVSRSIEQKETVFSSEGLSLIAVDFYYALKSMLLDLSTALKEGRIQQPPEEEQQQPISPIIENNAEQQTGFGDAANSYTILKDMVQLLRRLVSVENRGKTVERPEIDGVYPEIQITDEAIEYLQKAYTAKFGEKGIVIGRLADGEDAISDDGDPNWVDENADVVEASASSAIA